MNVAVWPGNKVVVAPEHVPVGPLRLSQVAVTPPAGAVGTSVTPTEVSVRLPVLKTVKVYAIGWPAAVTDQSDWPTWRWRAKPSGSHSP